MILFSQNSNLGLRTVTTVKGDTEYRRNCKHIGGKFYLLDRDCFMVDGKLYRTDGGMIIFDHYKQVWVHKNKIRELLKGVVGFEKETHVIGYFTPNVYNNVLVSIQGINMSCINAGFLKENGFFEDPAMGIWYKIKEFSSSSYRIAKSVRNVIKFTDRGYNIEDNSQDFQNKIQLYENYDLPVGKKAREMAKYLGNYTFGCEIEISEGNLPDNILKRHGIVVCRDGSIDGGPELVTIPLAKAKGLQNVASICEELENRSKISLACAFHVHFGNVPTDKLFLVAFYILSRKLQDEIFKMFPYYKTDYRGIKKKDYNQKLTKLRIHSLVNKDKESYEAYLRDSDFKIFNFLSEGKINPDQLNKKTRAHPIQHKWDRKNRYCWASVFNMYFGLRNTIEYRLHGPTTNSHKIINWMFICVAMIRYAEANALKIISGTDETIPLKEVLEIYPTTFPTDKNARFLSDYLYAYYESRKKRFKKDIDAGDKLSMWDIDEDKDYKFSFMGVEGLI